MLSVKEYAQSVYAKKLAQNDYVVLVFDGAYFGESEGLLRFQELSDVKQSDMKVMLIMKELVLLSITLNFFRLTINFLNRTSYKTIYPN